MKRFWIIAAAIVAMIGSLVAAMPLFVSPQLVRHHVEQQATMLTGRQISVIGEPRISWQPFLGIEIDNLVLEDTRGGDDATPLLQVERLRGRLSPWAALFGQADFNKYQLIRPRIFLSVDEQSGWNWAFTNGQVSELVGEARRLREDSPAGEKPDLRSIAKTALGSLQIIDGTVRYEDARSQRSETFTNIELTLDWSDTRSAAIVDGTTIWRDESFAISLRATEPLLLLAGGSSPLTAELASRAVDLSLNGDANLLSDWQLTGGLDLASPSVRRLSGFLGYNAISGPTLADLAIRAELQATPNQFKLGNAQISIDGNDGRGALQLVRREGKPPLISGTLAYGVLDLTPYGDAVRHEIDRGNDGISALGLIDAIELDLRLSAETVRLWQAEAGAFAAALSVRNGEGLFDIGNASIVGGTLVAKSALRRQGEDASVSVKGMLDGFDAASLTAAAGEAAIGIAGSGDLNFSLMATGNSATDLVENSFGRVQIAVREGEIRGGDLDMLRNRAQSQGEALQWSGSTPFTEMVVDLSVFRTNAWLSSMRLMASDLTMAARGQINLLDGGLALRMSLGPGGVVVGETGQEQLPPPDANLVIGGSIRNPLPSRDYKISD